MKTEKHDLAHYMAQPYTKSLRPDADGDIVARVVELPGCSAHGENEKEALRNLQEAQRLWLEDCIEAGDPVPEPEEAEPLPSGKWVQRVPRTLHQLLATTAKSEGVSLNQLVTSMLSEKLSLRAVEKTFISRTHRIGPGQQLGKARQRTGN
jgi:antitoxin HicB